MTIVTITATMVRSMAPPRNISHFAQSGVFDWGGAEGGGGDGDGDNSNGGDSVVKAPTALQAL